MVMRRYDNTLRQQQASATRTRILEAVRDLLAGAPTSLQIPDIAARAGVSEPTVYRHFPNREALLDAAATLLGQQLGEPPQARTIDDLPVVAMAVARFFDRNASWLRAAMAEPTLRPLRMAGRRRRVDWMRALVEPAMGHLDPDERRLAAAAFSALGRAETWDCLTREFGLTSDEAGRVMSWMMRALVDALAAGRRGRRRTLVDQKTLQRGQAWTSDATTDHHD